MEKLTLTFEPGQVLTSDNMSTIVSVINNLIEQVDDNTKSIQDLQPSGESEEQN